MSKLRMYARALAPLGCVALIGTALVNVREARLAADINDLKLAPEFRYQGRLYSKTNPSFQGKVATFYVQDKAGKKFTGAQNGYEVEGSVTPAGKVGGTVSEFDTLLTADDRNGEAPLPTYSFKGQLSADGSAIVGTYKIKGAAADQGTCWFEAQNAAPNR